MTNLKNTSGTYETLARDFCWKIPEHYNIGVDVCDKWGKSNPARVAIIDVDDNGVGYETTFLDLMENSNRLANALRHLGVCHRADGQSDRVAVLLAQSNETATSHVAIYKMGCVAVPLFALFAEEALLHRLRDSGAKVVITDREGVKKLSSIRAQLPELETIISIDGPSGSTLIFETLMAEQTIDFESVNTRAEDPAILIYTSGTTGQPKGALHAHRVLLGHLPGVEISHNFLPAKNDRFWTPADWAWIGGLLDVLLPSLHHGIPVVAKRFKKFTAEAAFELIAEHAIRNVFLPPTALKMMRQLPRELCPSTNLRSIASGGEALGQELLSWAREVLGTTINEFYGQTECNMVVSSCCALDEPLPGAMGRAVPGHIVQIIDPVSGEILPAGTEGAIAVRSPDPVMFLGYLNNPDATKEKFIEGPDGNWLLTGDRGVSTHSGWLHFVGRNDDVISSAGYRIGPGEIEDCLLKHENIQMAGVVGKPDELRGSVVAAYVVLSDGVPPSDMLAREIGQFVKERLAAHEYPRIVRFVPNLPTTTTGKIIRAKLREWANEEAKLEL